MTLSTGQRLGPHEILAPIGAGGMGEVYQARDTRLDRRIAIKVLPSEFSRSAALKARFEREAKAISALNHPNICTLHDIGHDGDIDYLVMEYLEGETLAERLRKGALPVEQVLRYGVQIAAALDAAHRQGIIHRDLKPANVMITRSGAKLLDFGLAKESPLRAQGVSLVSDLQTEQKALTAEGTIVGTFQYMAPEQLEGSELDARTDIFALGTLLYEMTTGVRAFDGKTKTSIIAAIVSTNPPPISSFQALTPAALEHVVRRCLAKAPDDRWQSAADIASELQWISEAGSGAAPVQQVGRRRVARQLWPVAALLAGVVLGAAAWGLIRSRSGQVPAISHFDIAPPRGMRMVLGHRRAFAVAPDESTVAFTAQAEGSSETILYLRKTTDFQAVEIVRHADAPDLAYSPDGRWLAYSSGGKLRKIAVDGGKPVDLCETSSTVGLHWSGSTIVFADDFSSGIWSVPAQGGERKLLFRANAAQKERAVIFPQLLPDGKNVLYTAWNGGSFEDANISVRSLETGEQKVVVRGGSDARYLPSGHLVYGRGGSLLAVRFDLSSLEAEGTPVTVEENVSTGDVNGEAQFAVSDRGTLFFAAGGILTEQRDLVWVDRKGDATPVVTTRRNYNTPSLSPDGTAAALTLEGSTFDIWILDFERDSLNRLSFGADDSNPYWSPDGSQVAWTSTRAGRAQVFVRASDGSGEERQLTNGPEAARPTSWAADGKTLAIRRSQAKSSRGDVWMLPIAGGGERAFRTNAWDESATFSRDGRWVALTSDESGNRKEVYVMATAGAGAKTKVSNDGGSFPVWSRDGTEIFYRKDAQLFAARFDASRMAIVGRPVMLFEGPYQESFDVARDGRFLMVRLDRDFRTASSYHAVAGWSAELERRVPDK